MSDMIGSWPRWLDRVPWPTWRAIYRPQQKRQRMVRMRPLLLPALLAFTAAVLPPNASIGQDAGFGRDADVHVREDSFACKETSELDRPTATESKRRFHVRSA